MTETAQPPAPAACGRRWRWLLVASLALNLLIIGGLAGLWMKGPPHGRPHWGASPTAFGLMRFTRDLPPERREAVRGHLKDARTSLRALRSELRDARRNAVEALRTPDYSTDKLAAAMAAVADVDNRMRAAGTEALMKGIAELTPEERAKLADAWTRRLEAGEGRRHRHGKDGLEGDAAPEGPAGPPGPPGSP